MNYDVEVYQKLDDILPSRVSRGLAESALKAGETESAISDLLDEAFARGALNGEVVEFVRMSYDDGPVIEMLEALLELRRSY